MKPARLVLAAASLALLQAGPAAAQTTSEASSIQQQEATLQSQITQGLDSGTLSASQVEALQQRLQGLQVGNAAGTAASPLGRVGTPTGETLSPLNSQRSTNSQGLTRQAGPPAPTTTQTTTGPDPFTYNTLGPDAYQSQKYQNPEYNVPAYPTTNPQSLGTTQQYTQPSAGVPYGAGYAQQPANQGVYVYRPGSSR